MEQIIKTYIFLHDQDILLHCENIGNFNMLKNKTYVFLGNKDVSKIENFDNLIIARNLPNNLEEYPKMCAYSGWYVLYKNNIIKDDYINLFEYDVKICDNLNERIISEIESSYDFYSYFPLKLTECFIGSNCWCKNLIEYYPNLLDKINEKAKEKSINLWSSTSNITMSKKFFYKYMKDSENLFNWIKDKGLNIGHDLERNLSVYQILEDNISVKYLDNNMIKHFQLDSHKTQGINNKNYNEVLI